MSARSACIEKVSARQILDSRGRPTIEVDVFLEGGAWGRACAPSGASTGRHEAHELRDGDLSAYGGRGVLKAVANASGEIARRVVGMDALGQRELDDVMIALDGSPSLRRLGANAVLATSLACARAAAAHSNIPLFKYLSQLAGTAPSMPMPMTNILSGGAHAGRGMDLQDFLVVPVGARSYDDALSMISRVRDSASVLMQKQGLSTLLADEGGLSPGFANSEEALELMMRAFDSAGLEAGVDVAITLDVAASELFNQGEYHLAVAGRRLTSAGMIDYIEDLARRFPIVSIEDPLDQDDWDNWRVLTRRLSDLQLVGDDLFATNLQRIEAGIESNVANAALIKLNQNGTLSGTLEAMKIARRAGYATIVSARSGETEDTFIADLAVGTGAGQIKIGSVRNSERLAKYNQLLRIAESNDCTFHGTRGIAGRYST